MLKAERQKYLVDLLKANEVVSVADISEKLNISMMTVRRDLDYFEQKGIIKKVHGGAMLLEEEKNQPSFQQRVGEYGKEKESIGKEAAKLIKNGSVIFFDAGTTPLSVINHIPDDIEFTAITSGLLTAVALCSKPKVDVISIGGYVHHTSYSSINNTSVEMIKRYKADMAFISTKAIIYPQGTFEALLPLVEIKKAIVESSGKVILLADHSKFESQSMCQVLSLDDIDMIITDKGITEMKLEEIKGIREKIIIAK